MHIKKAEIPNLVYNLSNRGDTVIYLDSQLSGHPENEYSYVAFGIEAYIKVTGSKLEIYDDNELKVCTGDPWGKLKEFYSLHESWLFGYLGYDLKNSLEHLSSSNMDKTGLPDMYFFKPETIIEISESSSDVNVVKGRVDQCDLQAFEKSSMSLVKKERIGVENYLKTVHHAKEYIREGDFYEVNLSHQMEYSFEGDPFDLYCSMKDIGPVPFGVFLNFDDVSVCCASPERFLSRRGRNLMSQPIKGTHVREKDDKECKGAESLRRSEKDKAENLMIVDLVRNDLSKVSEEGSVHVTKLFEIQSFETVFQMVSTVVSTIREGVDSISAISSCFPMGSMTGAPKIRAMKKIEELEEYKRGLYSGAIGYLKPNGDFDFNVVIRTAILRGQDLFYSVGGAITSDSEPMGEWEETLVKARALEKATEQF